MKLLHTSDWHLGRTLYGRKRYAEFEAFLAWLAQAIEDHGVDVLLVAGDVFDTTTPSNLAQSLYYRFLCRVASSRCRHVVVIAGNHDSPSFLDAPRELLK
jgi:exonuclease SbcD